jgi:hypothetical protein
VNVPLSASRRDRWQPIGVGVASAGTPIGISVLHPSVGVALMIVELSIALTIIATALFGTDELSGRAFRLLRWIGNRPEPASPQKTGCPRMPTQAGLTEETPNAGDVACGYGHPAR